MTTKGSTLAISILMISVIFASVYGLSNISIRNTRQFFNIVSGGTGIMGADGAVEKGLWAHIRDRGAFLGNCDATPAAYINESLQAPNDDFTISNCRTALLPNPSTLDIAPNTIKEAYIINPTDPSGPSNYSEVTFTWSAGSATIKVCSWYTADCSAGPHMAQFSQSAAGNSNTVVLNIAPDRYVILYETGLNGYTVSVSGKDESGNSKGLPADLATIIGLGKDLFTSRQVKVLVPQ